jgi:CubicO group peptidase (beta-lactamase class C family)
MNAKVKLIIKISLLAVTAVVLVFAGVMGWLFTAGLRTPVAAPQPDYWPTHGWQSKTPEELGFDSIKLAKGIQSLQENAQVDSLLIIHDGYVVLDAHFEPYDGKFPHDLASVTKSVMTTLIAIAAEQGKIDLDQPVVSFFPDRTIANLDERKRQITVRHLTRMVNGMESGCYEADEPTLDAMRSQVDWVQAALDRPMVADPGKEFCYDSPGMHLLSAILQETTGMTAFEFAQLYLFEPLGIQNAIWESDPQGYTRGWGDLHLLPEDLAKIGYLWLHRGNWNGKQIVSEAWVLDSVKAHSKFIEPDFGYGNGWWISNADYQASGRGGQRMRVVASRNTIVVVTAADDDYSTIDPWLTPMLIVLKDKLPANPEGLDKLEKTLAEVEQGPAVSKAIPTPETAGKVTGKTYLCDTNPVGLETTRIDFDSPGQATLFAKLNGEDMVLTISTDGNYHISPEGTGFRGFWEDTKTFQFNVFNIGVENRKMVFNEDKLEFSIPEADLMVICQMQNE